MAKQAGENKIIGTIQNITFYKMGDEYYARMKSSLTGKRFWKDAAFAGSRRSSERFAFGNKLASEVYRMLPEVKRCYAVYCTLKSLAIRLLKEGKHKEEVLEQLIVQLRGAEREKRKVRVRLQKKKPVHRLSVFVVRGAEEVATKNRTLALVIKGKIIGGW